MPRLRLIHWKRSEAAGYLQALNQAGFSIDYDERFRPALMGEWRRSPPDGFVIDLSRLPSHGREIAVALRQSAATRGVPIVFCAGDPEKVAAIRALLPDAGYCQLAELVPAVKKALACPPARPIQPTGMMDRYKSRTAAQKLGIDSGDIVAVVNPPRDFERVLGHLPDGIKLLETQAVERSAQVHLCFVQRQHHLLPALSALRDVADKSKVWVIWRKRGNAAAGDVTGKSVREHALDLGLVDYKICAVNEIWTAMLFARKR